MHYIYHQNLLMLSKEDLKDVLEMHTGDTANILL